MKYDYGIVGNGLAGSLIALQLLKLGKKIKVFDNPNSPSSSSVAGGMFNPVTGKYLTKTWLDEKLFPKLFSFYKNLEIEINQNFFHPCNIFRPFSNLENKKHFENQIIKNQLENYIQIVDTLSNHDGRVKAPLGGLLTHQAGWVDVPKMLKGIKSTLIKSGVFIEENFNYNELEIQDEKLLYKDLLIDKIIFCEGFYVKDNPFFSWLPFNPVKGETLLGKIEGFESKEIINQGKWLMPLGNQQVRLGATYSWHELDFNTTNAAKDQLLAGLERFYSGTFQILSQQAGIRPATKDRRPIIGVHPNYKNLFMFNGLGTKGVSLAPYFTAQFIDFLLEKKEINPETTIDRFFSLYS
jgi:glycine/D-amino acid oxidase-like deaminating enzyme